MAHRVISSDSEDEYDAPVQKNKPIKNNQIIDLTDESEDSDNPDINSFSSSASSSSDIYSEPESSLNVSLSPIQARRTMKQRTILSDDEEDDDSQPSEGRKPTSNDKGNSENKDTPENSSVHSESFSSEVNSPREEQTEVSKEINKENTPPLLHNLPPKKPMVKPVQVPSQAKPMNHVQLMPAKGLPQGPQLVLIPATHNQVAAYQLSHTRPALLKQLDNVKALQATIGRNLPDKGARLARMEQQIIERIISIKGGEMTLMEHQQNHDNVDVSVQQGWAKNRMLAQQYKYLTNDAVEQLHSAMQSRPASETEVQDPEELKTSLMPHQRRALAWALWRETQTPSGGILADDMGLGKTLTMLSLILAGRERSNSSGESSSRYCPTLVVCPASLMQQWDREIMSHVRTGHLKALIYHADGRKIDPLRLSQFDVVITTYGVVGSEGAAYLPAENDTGKKPKRKAAHHTLFEVEWNRIILDEGHTIKNPKTNASLGVCGLTSTHRWILTGTPVHNSLKDVYSLVKFLRLAPFSEYVVWKELVQKTGVGMQRLQTLMQSLLLRRTKEEIGNDGQPLIRLPSKQVITHHVTLNEDEQCVFDLLFVQCRSRFLDYLREIKEGVDSGQAVAIQAPNLPSHLSNLPAIMSRLFASVSNSNTAIVLVTILRLLQCSCHLGLLGRVMEVDQQEVDQLETQLAAMSLESANASPTAVGRSWPAQGTLPKCFDSDVSSSKVSVLLEVLKDVLGSTDHGRSPKCVLVSQWSSYLDIIEKHVRNTGFTFVRIDGSVPPKKRNSLVEEFNSSRAHPQLLLMTLKTGGVGLNLSRGNHLFLMDLHWNPALEQQAADRIHRLGQINDVTIHRFLCEKTAEEKVVQIQESKKKLATDVLSCTTGMASKNKLTLEDLKLLFSV